MWSKALSYFKSITRSPGLTPNRLELGCKACMHIPWRFSWSSSLFLSFTRGRGYWSSSTIFPFPVYQGIKLFSSAGRYDGYVLFCFWSIVMALISLEWLPLWLHLGVMYKFKVSGSRAVWYKWREREVGIIHYYLSVTHICFERLTSLHYLNRTK